jgi:phosphoglycolate phosphatase
VAWWSDVPRFRLIVFDWDGTLADSEQRIVGCFSAAAASLRLGELPRERFRSVIGLALPESVEVLFPRCDTAFRDAFVTEYRRHWLAPGAPRTQLFEGVVEVLDRLVEQGHRLAIATGKGRRGLERDLADVGLAHRFCATRCADESRSKPHPLMLEQLLEQTGVDRSEAVVVGDTSYDLAMARAAEVAAIGVAWGMHPREELVPHQPLAIIDTLPELPELPELLARLGDDGSIA